MMESIFNNLKIIVRTLENSGLEHNTFIKVPIAANWKGVCLQNTSKPHSYHLKIW